MSSVTFDVAVGGDGSTVTDDNNATTGLREGGWKTRFVPCFTQQVAVANYIVTKAGEASTSASAASSSATAAAASYDSFDDRYLGAKSSDPSVDNDGNALLTGALYWNAASSVMKVWSGTAWVSYNPAIGYLALSGGTMTGAITFAAGQTIAGYLPLTGGTMTGAITFADGQFGTNVNTFLSTPSSANLLAAITDETGTGLAVFNNTPTLIAPILGTPTSGNLSNCTNAVGYGLKSATTTVSVSGATAPTTGQALIATSSTDATWQTPSSGAIVYLSTVTASGAGSADIETTIDATYDHYIIDGINIGGSVSDVNLLVEFKISGSYVSPDYYQSTNGANPPVLTYGGGGIMAFHTGYAPSTSQRANFSANLFIPSSTTASQVFQANGSWYSGYSSIPVNKIDSTIITTGGSAITGVRFKMSSGTITGTFILYGVKKS